MVNEDALSRLRAKTSRSQRAAVPPRTDALASQLQKPEEAIAPTEEASSSAQAQTGGDALADLRAQLDQLPQTKRHSAIVLEVATDAALTDFCRDRGITLELFLESAWSYLSTKPAVLDELVGDAKKRRAKRVEAGKIRRLISQMEKLKG